MLITISASESLYMADIQPVKSYTIPVFIKESGEIITLLKRYSKPDLMKLLRTSRNISDNFYNRYKHWELNKSKDANIALFIFKGDMYESIRQGSLTLSDYEFANKHIRILSGLYGMLRPLDIIYPYRLSLKTKLENEKGNSLYKFWSRRLSMELKRAVEENNINTILNLSSKKDFKVIDLKLLKKPVLGISFLSRKTEPKKTKKIFRKAKGAMINYIIKNRIVNPEELKGFVYDKFLFDPGLSTKEEWVYVK